LQQVKLIELENKLKSHPKLKNLKQFLIRFLEQYSAEFIILFGSSAKGNFNYRSDIDLLLVSNSLGDDYFERLHKMQTITPGGIDFFIYTSKEFEKMIHDFQLMALEALASGIIIYDKGQGEKYKKYINNLIRENKIQKLEQGWKVS
jgi:predicted nucleotidyltransferase